MLSDGEGQRIKLATALARVDTGYTLYVLDEPTSGLHFDDSRRLLDILNRLVDLGPESGTAGGHLLAADTPEEIATLPENSTRRFLRPLLNGNSLPYLSPAGKT